ncbi:peroxiredoxin [Chitinilyticum piscinae]|uniref:thioredoxin-dependent peroxiredoxin n=1 Tax=Chitinilyticum piscinae TaxID=2866724 RepID=A0A8J7FN82_9NEIS|nr:peroxiredoxin [Chitinilyticum piscinae]MBE9609781.1 peroxiredoxin [Chitinilyticum piscinae]
MLQAGDLAPDFELPDARMELLRLSSFRETANIVLYFFNKDHTPGGITEAVEFNELLAEFARHDTVVLGVSLDDCLAHEAFREEEGLDFDLLADTEGEVSRLYHVLTEWQAQGMVRYGIERSTFVIDKAGVIRLALYHVQPKGHAAEVFAYVKQLGQLNADR